MQKEINYIQEFDSLFTKYFSGLSVAEDFKTKSLQIFYGKLKNDAIANYLEIAYNKFPDDPDTCLKYFCGICWKEIKKANGVNNEAEELVTHWRKISYIAPYQMSQWMKFIGTKQIKEDLEVMMEKIKGVMDTLCVERKRGN